MQNETKNKQNEVFDLFKDRGVGWENWIFRLAVHRGKSRQDRWCAEIQNEIRFHPEKLRILEPSTENIFQEIPKRARLRKLHFQLTVYRRSRTELSTLNFSSKTIHSVSITQNGSRNSSLTTLSAEALARTALQSGAQATRFLVVVRQKQLSIKGQQQWEHQIWCWILQKQSWCQIQLWGAGWTQGLFAWNLKQVQREKKKEICFRTMIVPIPEGELRDLSALSCKISLMLVSSFNAGLTSTSEIELTLCLHCTCALVFTLPSLWAFQLMHPNFSALRLHWPFHSCQGALLLKIIFSPSLFNCFSPTLVRSLLVLCR